MDNNAYVKTDDGMIINTRMDEFDQYKMARARAVREKALSNRVDKIEQDLIEIRSILQKIYSRIS